MEVLLWYTIDVITWSRLPNQNHKIERSTSHPIDCEHAELLDGEAIRLVAGLRQQIEARGEIFISANYSFSGKAPPS
ncbi:MAG TPA: hypothetical protein VJG64_01060 [Candidatus Paceibacterota bacterium]